MRKGKSAAQRRSEGGFYSIADSAQPPLCQFYAFFDLAHGITDWVDVNQSNVDRAFGLVHSLPGARRQPLEEEMNYSSRVKADLERWIDSGWVDSSYRELIHQDLTSRSRRWSAAGALSILGAILLAMSAISFVAANWDAMPKLLVFSFLIAAIWLSMLGAGRALDKGANTIGHALALLGALLFGAAIALTAQTFNMASFRNTAVLIWSLAALATAWAIPSRPNLILATLLSALWVGLEIANPAAPDIMWSYIGVWMLMMLSASRLQSLTAANLLALALLLWISNAIWRDVSLSGASELELAVLHPLIYGAIALAAARLRNLEWRGFGVIAAWLGIAAIIGGAVLQWPLGPLQDSLALDTVADEPAFTVSIHYLVAGGLALITIIAMSFMRSGALAHQFALSAGLALAGFAAFALPFVGYLEHAGTLFILRLLVGAAFYILCVSLILMGSQEGYRATGTMGVIGFVIQTFYVYWETFEGLLTASLFFLGAGLLLFGLSFVLLRWRHRLLPPSEHANPTQAPEAGS